ncbi:oxygen-independent coproporphyrinogen III oxidase [Niveibacterium terrae]|uniref:oxygen-independent coproporphyrinogen III oxidase n=1 Tax=Niveibacterium terrae TaxID=3373598 RepID=UPI003A8E9ED5
MNRDDQKPVFDPQLIRRFDVSGPRYTSYPTADRFHERFTAPDLMRLLGARSSAETGKPLSLYFHIPFCDTVCFYCACNKYVTKDHSQARTYLSYLDREMALVSSHLAGSRKVAQMHWGGGTPTFLAADEISALCASIRSHFELVADGEYSIEIDPRRIKPGVIELLGREGFNRLSVGVQDFDPLVQKAVNRIQSFAETAQVVADARANGFRSVSLDLIYGLPLQTPERFSATLDRVLELAPDRLALYNYAHLPTHFMPQRRISEADLPSPEGKLEILGLAIEKLTEAGYLFIGMDHFAKPDDELAIAQREGQLYRNFQGYSTHSGCDLLGFGVSAIGQPGAAYSQNEKTLEGYYAALDQGRLPVVRGYEMDEDDRQRYAIIQALMCDFALTFAAVEKAWGIRFAERFAVELAELAELAEAGLCEMDAGGLRITESGRMLVRVIAMVFDRHLRERRGAQRYSKVI